MNVLIVGYGSIGTRHARLLEEKGHKVICVTGNPDCPFPTSSSIADAVDAYSFELAIIANATVNHHDSLKELLATGYAKRILIEKPLFEKAYDALNADTNDIFVAYNLRFHPLIQRTFDLLKGKRLNSARFHVGQYLPDWRPDTDYRNCYSAHKEQGGGVLRDLSHELDLVLWMFEGWTSVTATGGQFSDLEISSDDVFSLLVKTKRCPAVTINLDYLNYGVRRGFNIIAEGMSLNGDLVAGALDINGEVEKFVTDRDTTYTAQLEALTCPSHSHLCTYAQGDEVIRLIDAAETAANDLIWVKAS
ncbi:MAG: Gfo/Idh/MocA family oxidoreductase [Pseudodesulfovibrio sp.]|nr:Gfo/Idh/MocA family oxidoreductase [Pseudodesulfovibrio sp.]